MKTFAFICVFSSVALAAGQFIDIDIDDNSPRTRRIVGEEHFLVDGKIRLNRRPVPGSLAVYVEGLRIADSCFSRTGLRVTIRVDDDDQDSVMVDYETNREARTK